MDVPVVQRRRYQLVDISEKDGFLCLMDDKSGDIVDGVRIPTDQNLVRDIEHRLESGISTNVSITTKELLHFCSCIIA